MVLITKALIIEHAAVGWEVASGSWSGLLFLPEGFGFLNTGLTLLLAMHSATMTNTDNEARKKAATS